MSRKPTLLLTVIFISCFCAVSVSAQRRSRTSAPPAQQNPARQNNATQEASRNEASQVPEESADIVITATVTAKELRFEAVPNPTVEFPGNPKRDTVWDAVRDNLPRPVEAGVTYRNIGIRLKIVSRFADIDRIVAEALGEVPLTNEVQPQGSTPPQQPNTPMPASTPRPEGGSSQ
jgi:hypothetical protein